MNTVTAFIVLTLTLSPIATVMSSETCPLINNQERYLKLQEAVSLLSSSIAMPKDCKAEQEELEEKATELQSSITSAGDNLYEETGSGEVTEKQKSVMDAGLMLTTTLNNLSPKCRESAMNAGDYINSVFDTINGLGPLFLITGGASAAPFVFGTIALGSVTNSIIRYFENKSINMKDEKERKNFIKNACEFNKIIINRKSLRNEIDNKQTEIEKLIASKKQELARVKSEQPEESARFKALTDEIKKLSAQKKELEKLDSELKADAGISQTKDKKDFFSDEDFARDILSVFIDDGTHDSVSAKAIKLNYSRVITRSAKRFRKNYVDAEVYNQGEGVNYFNNVMKFITNLDRLISKTLATRSKKLAKEGSKSDQKSISSLTKQISELQARQKLIKSLVARGTEFQRSELAETSKGIKKALFGTIDGMQGFIFKNRKSHAFEYLKHKTRKSFEDLKNFKKHYSNYVERLRVLSIKMASSQQVKKMLNKASADVVLDHVDFSKIKRKGTKIDLCASADLAWDLYFDSQAHVATSDNFCKTFDHTINATDYSRLRKYCFGVTEDLLEEMPDAQYIEENMTIVRNNSSAQTVMYYAGTPKTTKKIKKTIAGVKDQKVLIKLAAPKITYIKKVMSKEYLGCN